MKEMVPTLLHSICDRRAIAENCGAALIARRYGQTGFLLVLGLTMSACSPQASPPTQEQTTTQSAELETSLDRVETSILGTTGLTQSDVDVSWNAGQFTVTIINSPLNNGEHSVRNTQAIANAITSAISGMPEFAAATGIHVNYIARPASGAEDSHVDGIDFRKDASGLFTLHTT